MRKILFGCALLAVLSLNASAIVLIDHFSDGTFKKQAPSGTITDSQNKLNDVISIGGGTLSGQRDVKVTITDVGTSDVQVSVNNPMKHVFSLAFPPLGKGPAELSYGDYTSLGALGADMGKDFGLTFDLVFADLTAQVVVDIHAKGNTYTCTPVSINVKSGLFQIPFSTFPGLVASGDLSQVDGLHYTITSTEDALDLVIDALSSTQQIPEPATMSLLGLGVLALIRRRRKS